MTSILDLNSDCSDSESDCDYVPPGGEASDPSSGEQSDKDDALGDDEPESTGKGTKKVRRRTKKTVSATKDKVDPEKSENEDKPKLSEADEKKRVENLWSSFLEDVTPVQRKKVTIAEPDFSKVKETCESTPSTSSKITITEVFEFAGESVSMTKEVDSTSEEALQHKLKKAIETPAISESNPVDPTLAKKSAPKRAGGLSSIVGNLGNKKQKLTTLQKSLFDWNSFKKEQGIKEELEKHNKGKGGFLEKQAFLQRSDLRQFEAEKSLRLSNKTKR